MNNRSTSFPARVGVLGGGRMGAGIAHAFLIHGSRVIVVERDEVAAENARGRVLKAVRGSVDRGILDSGNDAADRLQVGTDAADFSNCDLVIEAVPEMWDLKVSSLRMIENSVAPGTLIASNTSSLSVSKLADELDEGSRFLGMHFFNPVPSSELIEIIVGEDTSPDAVTEVLQWSRALGKVPIVARDIPGFASSRLGAALALEAMRMVEEGVASAEDIDTAMVLGYKHATGPLRTTDIVGLDVRLGIARYLESTLGERFAPPQILIDKVEKGELGRKAGKGFYDWG